MSHSQIDRRTVLLLGTCLIFLSIGVIVLRVENIIGAYTEFTNGYSEEGFNSIKTGMTRANVQQVLGDPFWISRAPVELAYQDENRRSFFLIFNSDAVEMGTEQCIAVHGWADEWGEAEERYRIVLAARGSQGETTEFKEFLGQVRASVVSALGSPLEESRRDEPEVWWYSRSPTSSHFVIRTVIFNMHDGLVQGIEKGIYWD